MGSIKVLHVDDETTLLDQAKIFLEKEEEKLDVTTVQMPKKALELLKKEDFDVIVSDYQMAGMDGLEFLEVVREERERNSIHNFHR
ncbi:MAG: response regulator [Thermoplasmata archaeon]